MPFVVTPNSPILFIEPDEVTTHPLSQLPQTDCSKGTAVHNEASHPQATYAQTFAQTLQALQSGKLQKMVLARQCHCTNLRIPQAEQLFYAACQSNPHHFVSLWLTEQYGNWLVATPEPLFCMNGTQGSTVALAGTMPFRKDGTSIWDEKNQEEQAIVAQFIQKELQPFVSELNQSPTHTLRSGNIQHLCTDFTFRLHADNDQRTVIAHLHPTPAVCGMPRNEALQHILRIEPEPRTYYAGFSGPFNLDGTTHLFVTLRCMRFSSTHATLYAGGGIMPNSVEQEEWEETVRKMQTMLQLLA